MSDWGSASPAERLLAWLSPSPWWLRAVMRVTVHLPGRLGWVYDRLERYKVERYLRSRAVPR